MSEGCLTTYKDQYTNVYQKGALIGLCLDIKLQSIIEWQLWCTGNDGRSCKKIRQRKIIQG